MTALIDTIYLGLKHMRESQWARRGLLVISDGKDNRSRYSQRELMRVALEADVKGLRNCPGHWLGRSVNSLGPFPSEHDCQAVGPSCGAAGHGHARETLGSNRWTSLPGSYQYLRLKREWA
jgi:hypothetical protein